MGECSDRIEEVPPACVPEADGETAEGEDEIVGLVREAVEHPVRATITPTTVKSAVRLFVNLLGVFILWDSYLKFGEQSCSLIILPDIPKIGNSTLNQNHLPRFRGLDGSRKLPDQGSNINTCPHISSNLTAKLTSMFAGPP